MSAQDSFQCEFRHGGLVIRTFSRDILERKEAMVKAIATLIRTHQPKAALVDLRAVPGEITFMDRYELGEQALREDRRKAVDPAYKRQLSVFQVGWRLLRRLISCATPPPCTLRLSPFKPEPLWYGKC